MPLSTEEFIRDAASRNWSRLQTREALGICRYKFDAICEAMPDVKWPANGCSMGHQRGQESRRGYDPEILQRSRAKAIEKVREMHSYDVFGQRGTINQLAHLSNVTAATIRRRIRNGMSPVDAFTNPAMPRDDRARMRGKK